MITIRWLWRVAGRYLLFKTPIMTTSVGTDFRTKWFKFIRDKEDALLKTDRLADMGVWFSPDTKTFHDFAQGGISGMCLDLVPPPGVESWWAVSAPALEDNRSLASDSAIVVRGAGAGGSDSIASLQGAFRHLLLRPEHEPSGVGELAGGTEG